jgi:hypothetical protein
MLLLLVSTTLAFEGHFTLVTTAPGALTRVRFRVDEAGAIEAATEGGSRRSLCLPSAPETVWTLEDAERRGSTMRRADLASFLQTGPTWTTRRWTTAELPPHPWQGQHAVGTRLTAKGAPELRIWTVPGHLGARDSLACLGATTAPAILRALGARDGLPVRSEADDVVVTIEDLVEGDEATITLPGGYTAADGSPLVAPK